MFRYCFTLTILIMNYLLQISASHPLFEQLKKAITDLLVFVEAGTVYISTEEGASSPTVITCILRKDNKQPPTNLVIAAKKLQCQHPNLVFRFITSYCASQGFKKGTPFLIKHCTLLELCYYECGSKVFQPTRNRLKKLLQLAKYSFQSDREVVLGDFKVALDHLKRQEPLETGVGLYRAYWSLFRWYSGFFIGELEADEAGGIDGLVSEYNRLVQYVPRIRTMLDQDLPEDQEIFTLLSTANWCQLNNSPMAPINWSVLERASQKFEQLVDALDHSFAAYAMQCKLKMTALAQQTFNGASVLTQPFKPNYFAVQALSEISAKLAGFLTLRGLYCFGCISTSHRQLGRHKAYRKALPSLHFYLLVLHSDFKDNLYVRLKALIGEATGGLHTVTLLCQRMQQLRRQHQHHRFFMNKILLNGYAAYKDTVYPCTPVVTLPERDLVFSAKYWRDRLLVARQFLNLAGMCKNSAEELVKNALLQQAVQQLVVAQLELFLGCRPKHYGIGYLLSLLACIPSMPLLFTASEMDLRLQQLLSADLDMLKHKQLDHHSIEASGVLYQKCEVFYATLHAIGLEELKRIENFNV